MALSLLSPSSAPSDYLKTVTGTKAIDFEVPILAITALGKDPRNFGNQDLVAKLESFHTAGQIGDPTTLNDDIFGLLALVSAGQPLTDPAIADVKSFLLAHQNADGGWSFSAPTGSSDSNTTATAIVALAAVGVAAADIHIVNGLNYLKTAQNADGGFTYDPKSQYGTASDSSSTAWVLWALNALSIDQATWSKGSNTPKTFLELTQNSTGFFQNDTGDTTESSFTPVATAYAVIALNNKTLPVKIISPATAQSYSFRIEGSLDTVCTGKALGPTALDIVKNAASQCGYTYNIQQKSFGPYLNQINTDTAFSLTGWQYFVNNLSPDVGAADYQLKAGDEVLWYFGDFGWQPTRLTLSQTQINTGQSAQATVESFNKGAWTALSGATIALGTKTFTSDVAGIATMANQDGFYKVGATKTGFIRSNTALLQIGQAGSSAVGLTANVTAGQVAGETTDTGGTISFTINPASLDFGTLKAGTSTSKTITITSSGSTGIHIESIVSGDNLFTDNLTLNNLVWQVFKLDLTAGQHQDAAVKFAVPANFKGSSGQKNGQIIFWASAK